MRPLRRAPRKLPYIRKLEKAVAVRNSLLERISGKFRRCWEIIPRFPGSTTCYPCQGLGTFRQGNGCWKIGRTFGNAAGFLLRDHHSLQLSSSDFNSDELRENSNLLISSGWQVTITVLSGCFLLDCWQRGFGREGGEFISLGPPIPRVAQWKNFGPKSVEFEVLMCGGISVKFLAAIFPGNWRTKICDKFRQIFAAFFASLFRLTDQNVDPNFALGNYRHNISLWKNQRTTKRRLSDFFFALPF